MSSFSGQGPLTSGGESFDPTASAVSAGGMAGSGPTGSGAVGSGAVGSGTVGSIGSRRVQATVITEAEPSYDDQLKRRRIRYMIMMGMRVPFLIVACLLYQTPWLALLVIAISVPLPWMAVLIANDRPARKRAKVVPGTINYERALPAPGNEVGRGRLRDTETVDADPDLSAGATGRS